MANIYYNYSGAFLPGTLARAEAVAAEYTLVQKGFDKISNQGTDTGTANHYTFTTPGYPVAAYQDGNNVQFKALNTNTGASDVNVNGIGVVPLTRFNGAALLAGDVSAGSWYIAVYQVAFGAFTIISPAAYTTFAGTISGAAPANKVGLTAAGGSATSAIPIDATLAIDQAIIPTWTGLHTFNGKVVVGAPASGVGLTVTGVAGASAAQFLTTGVQIGSPTGGDKGSGTLNVASGLYVNGTLVASGAIVTSITGTANQIAASASTGAVTLSMPQNVIVPTPAAGTALTVTSAGANTAAAIFNSASNSFSATANAALILNNASGSQTPLDFQFGGVLGSRIRADSSNNLSLVSTGSGSISLFTGGDSGVGGQRVAITSAGNVTVNTPSSGTTLVANGQAGQYAVLAQAASGALSAMGITVAGAAEAQLQINAPSVSALFGYNNSGSTNAFGQVTGTLGIGLATAQPIVLITSGAERVRVAAVGNVTINAPSSGTALSVTGASGAATLSVQGAGSGNTGFVLRAGAAAGDTAMFVQNAAASASLFYIWGDGGVQIGAATGGNLGAGSLNTVSLYVNSQPVYAGIPQNLQTGNYTCVLADANKHIYKSGSATVTFTIPANASVAYPVGTAITFAGGNGTGSTTLAITTDTLNWAPSGTSGSRTLTGPFVATAIKLTSTFWQLTGVGIS